MSPNTAHHGLLIAVPLHLAPCQVAKGGVSTAPPQPYHRGSIQTGGMSPGSVQPTLFPCARPTILLTPFCLAADDDAFEPAEARPPTPGDGSGDGASPRRLEHPLPTAGASLADLEDSADSSSALLVPPDPGQSGSTPATEALPGGGRHSRSSLSTVV